MEKRGITTELITDKSSFSEYKEDVDRVTIKAWADFGETVDKWLNQSTYLAINKKDNEVVGFSLVGVMGDSDLVFISTMVLPAYQNLGLAVKNHSLIIKSHYLNLMKANPIKALSGFYFTFRTPNPRLYSSVMCFSPYPRVQGDLPPQNVLSIARKVHLMFSPKNKFDEKRMVIEKALTNSDLFYNENNYPRCKNDAVNKLFEESINYKNNTGNLIVVVGRFSLPGLFRRLI